MNDPDNSFVAVPHGRASELHVRPVAPEDQAEWLRLRLALWPEDSVADHRAQMADVSAGPTQIALVLCRADGKLGGFIEATIHPRAIGCATHHVAYIEGWYVDADLRRQGWGARLMRAAESWGRSQGATEVASDTQLENDVSRRAHLALGYHEAGRLIHFAKRL